MVTLVLALVNGIDDGGDSSGRWGRPAPSVT
jgi:hypothetical protein